MIALWYCGIRLKACGEGAAASERHTALYLSYERKYVAYQPWIGYKETPWDADPAARWHISMPFPWEGEPFTPPTVRGTLEDGLTAYLPYAEATWEALKEIEQYLSIAGARMGQHLSSPEGIETILEASRRLFDHLVTRVDAGSDTE